MGVQGIKSYNSSEGRTASHSQQQHILSVSGGGNMSPTPLVSFTSTQSHGRTLYHVIDSLC